MKSFSRLSIGLFPGLFFGHLVLASDINFGPALGTYPAHYSQLKNPWWLDNFTSGWDGWSPRPNIRRDLHFNGELHPWSSSVEIDFSRGSAAATTPELSQGFFRPAP